MRVFDSFLFSGIGTEADLLECRLRELDGTGVHHVIIEGNTTFQGRPKAFTFEEEHRERFLPWEDQITYVPVTPSTEQPGKEPGETWAREHSSRQAAGVGLNRAGVKTGDIVLHGDADEIPSRDAIKSLVEHADEIIVPYKLSLKFYMFAVDWEVPWRWHAPSVMRWPQVLNFTHLRENGWPDWPHCQPAGWHMTWLGGEQAAVEKVHAFSHDEAIPETLDGLAAGRYLTQGTWWPGRGRWHETQFTAVDVDDSWPGWIAASWDPVHQEPAGPAPAIWFRPRRRARAS